MSLMDELSVDLDTAHRLLGQLAQTSLETSAECAALGALLSARVDELRSPPPPDECKQALERTTPQLSRASQSSDEAAARLQKIEAGPLQEGLGKNRSALEELTATAQRTARAAASQEVHTALAESASRSEALHQQASVAQQQLQGQTRGTWEALTPARSSLLQAHQDAVQETTRCQRALDQHHLDFVQGSLEGAARWLDEQHRPGVVSVVQEQTGSVAGALGDYTHKMTKATEVFAQTSQESTQAVQTGTAKHLSAVESGLKRTTISLQGSQSRTQESVKLAQNAADHAPRVLGLLAEVHQLSQTLDPKAWTLP